MRAEMAESESGQQAPTTPTDPAVIASGGDGSALLTARAESMDGVARQPTTAANSTSARATRPAVLIASPDAVPPPAGRRFHPDPRPRRRADRIPHSRARPR